VSVVREFQTCPAVLLLRVRGRIRTDALSEVTMRIRVTICILLAGMLWATCIKSQQNDSEMDEQTKSQVKQLRAISNAIKACPREQELSTREDGTFYIGPPSNVIWDVKPTSSARAPYLGYVEFFLPREFSGSKKFCSQNKEYCAQMMLLTSFRYRFEFDLGPDGLELMKLLAKSKDDKEWRDVRPDASGLVNTCWLKAARASETR